MLALVAATGAGAAPAATPPLVTYKTGGGLLRCEPKTCVVAITIDRRGTVRSLRKDGSVLRQVRLGAPAGNRLARLVATTPLARLACGRWLVGLVIAQVGLGIISVSTGRPVFFTTAHVATGAGSRRRDVRCPGFPRRNPPVAKVNRRN